MERVLHANEETALNPGPFDLVERDVVARERSAAGRTKSPACSSWPVERLKKSLHAPFTLHPNRLSSWRGPGHPAAAYVYSEDRKGEHPATHLKGFRGVLQVDGYAGFGRLVADAGNVSRLAFCWAHARRKFYDIYAATQSPLAGEALRQIAALYEIEDEIRGQALLAVHRTAARR